MVYCVTLHILNFPLAYALIYAHNLTFVPYKIWRLFLIIFHINTVLLKLDVNFINAARKSTFWVLKIPKLACKRLEKTAVLHLKNVSHFKVKIVNFIRIFSLLFYWYRYYVLYYSEANGEKFLITALDSELHFDILKQEMHKTE